VCDRLKRNRIPKELSRLSPPGIHSGHWRQTAAVSEETVPETNHIPVIVEIPLSPVKVAAGSDCGVLSDVLSPFT